MLVGYQEQREFHLPLESIYYVDSTDSKTFLYQEQAVYQCRETLATLEEKLRQTVGFSFLPYAQYIFYAGIQLASRIIRKERIH